MLAFQPSDTKEINRGMSRNSTMMVLGRLSKQVTPMTAPTNNKQFASTMIPMRSCHILFICLLASNLSDSASFTGPFTTERSRLHQRTALEAAASGRLGERGGRSDVRSKRQERVGHLVRTELAQILHSGNIKGSTDFLEDELRRRISVVNTDVSPDLRQARVSVSIRRGTAPAAATGGVDDTVMEQRRAYSWLVSNTKALRHSLAQRMSHMKTCPDLTFVQVNVGAAVDVMYLIDKVSKGYKREVIDDELTDDDEGGDWLDDAF